jgi:hypothetical protein
MSKETIAIETLFTDYVDQFSTVLVSSTSTANSSKYVYWTGPKTPADIRDLSKRFNKENFINKIKYPTGTDTALTPSFNYYLDNLTQLELACITPTIELFRRDYLTSRSSSYIQREFVFNNTTGSYEFDLNNKGTSYYNPNQFSAGIKSIDYTFAGTNPAESERAIDVSITFSFSSFDALVGKQVSTAGLIDEVLLKRERGTVIDPTDWVNSTGETGKKGVTRNFLSLITYPPSQVQLESITRDSVAATGTSVYVPNYFEVLLKLGWRIADSNDLVKKEIFKGKEKFVELINNGKYDQFLYLNLVNHEISLTEEGTLELKVNYIGSFETKMMGTTEIDFLLASYKSLRSSVPRAADVSSEKEQLSRLVDLQNSCPELGERIKTRRTTLEQEINQKTQEAETDNNTVLYNIYNRFITFILEKRIDDIRYIILDDKVIEQYNATLETDYRDNDLITTLIANLYSRPGETAGLRADSTGVQKLSEELVQLTRTPPSSSESNIDLLDRIKKFFSDSNADLLKEIDEKFKNTPLKEDVRFYYMPFGALLDNIIEFMIENFKGSDLVAIKNIDIVLGDFVYTSRESIESNQKLLPLWFVPISLNSFFVWFKDYIVSKQKVNYPLRELLNDLINGLLLPSLKGESKRSVAIGDNYSAFIEYIPHDMLFNYAPTPTLQNRQIPRIGDTREIDASKIDSIKNPAPFPPTRTLIYISISQRRISSFGRVLRDITLDRTQGISHFFVGDTRGLIKSIKFKRIDQPGFKEAKVTKDGFIPLNQLRDIYSVDITMYGNHYYYPGQLIYVHPFVSVMGEPSTKNTVSNIMGMGGYYDVIKVSTVLSKDNYETTLECFWNSSGESRTVTSDEERRRRCAAESAGLGS